eukprot:TRINITY_DN3779_c0_g1_i1.p1 TRINITY_DN3779_c0_g1~~TRINITY_DN3779_c0_g1_i1.p1  ORF type:complete len:2107 (-),score=549.17 TRINITY_DN3779_c0_g1_i1:67-5526(-)
MGDYDEEEVAEDEEAEGEVEEGEGEEGEGEVGEGEGEEGDEKEGGDEKEKEPKEAQRLYIPQLVNLGFFMKHHPRLITDFFINTLRLVKYDPRSNTDDKNGSKRKYYIDSYMPSIQYSSVPPKLEKQYILEYIKKVVSMSSIETFTPQSQDRFLFSMGPLFKAFKPCDLHEFLDAIKPILDRITKEEHDFCQSYMHNYFIQLFNHISDVETKYHRVTVDKWKKQHSHLDGIQFDLEIVKKNQVAVEMVLDMYISFYKTWNPSSSDFGPCARTYVKNLSTFFKYQNLPVSCLEKILDALQDPFFSKTTLPNEDIKDNWINNWESLFELFIVKILKFVNLKTEKRLITPVPNNVTEGVSKIQERVLQVAFKWYAREPLKQVNRIGSAFNYLKPEECAKYYTSLFTKTQVAQLAVDEENIKLLGSKLWKYLPSSTYQEHLKELLESTSVSEVVKDYLQRFRDVTDHTVRKEITKQADSASIDQRKQAIFALRSSSFRADDPVVQLKRTLTYVRTKIKNEKIETRTSITKSFFDYLEDDSFKDKNLPFSDYLFPKGVNQEIFDIWFDMLKDALQVKDLDDNASDTSYDSTKDHPLLQHYLTLSKLALVNGASDPSNGLFEFGAEIQWRIAQFRYSPKELYKEFHLDLSERLYAQFVRPPTFPLGSESTLVKMFFEAMEKRVGAKNKDWKLSYKAMKPIYVALHEHWDKSEELKSHIKFVIESIKKEKKDKEGFAIIEDTHISLLLLNNLIILNKLLWHKNETIIQLMEAVLHTRQAPAVVFQWIVGREKECKKRKEKKQKRFESITTLLKLSSSAIYLDVVWRFLVKWHPELLTPFLNSKSTFRGVFYVEPNERKFKSSRSKKTKKPAVRARRRPAKTKVIKYVEFVDTHPKAVGDVKKVVRKEAKNEEKMNDELKENPLVGDHHDYFCLPACYGLHHLLPSQVERLADQWKSILLNPDRSMNERNKAAARWTIMPTVTYADIVHLIDRHSKEYKDENGRVYEALDTLLIETLLRGVQLNDEPLAPLNYLLSSKFLSSDYARIAAYSIRSCVPLLQAGGLTEIVKLVLQGKRRENLKVTAYKEVVRLLSESLTSTHIDMIEREWNRKELHRDVRIVVIRAAFLLLKLDSERSTKVAWDIINTTISKQGEWKQIEEMLTALLGVVPEKVHPRRMDSGVELNKQMFINPGIVEYHAAISKTKVPRKFCEQFAKDVILKLAKTASDDDVRTVALFSLLSFMDFGVKEEAVELISQLLTNASHPLLESPVESNKKIYVQRCKAGVNQLISYSNIPTRYMIDIKHLPPVLSKLINNITQLKNDHQRRRIFHQSVELLIKSIPLNNKIWDWTSPMFTEDQEKLIQDGFSSDTSGLFEEQLLKRKIAQLFGRGKSKSELLKVYHEAFLFSTKKNTSVILDCLLPQFLNDKDSAAIFESLLKIDEPLVESDENYKNSIYKLVRTITALKFAAPRKQLSYEPTKLIDSIANFVASDASDVSSTSKNSCVRDDANLIPSLLGNLLKHEQYESESISVHAINVLKHIIQSDPKGEDKKTAFYSQVVKSIIAQTDASIISVGLEWFMRYTSLHKKEEYITFLKDTIPTWISSWKSTVDYKFKETKKKFEGDSFYTCVLTLLRRIFSFNFSELAQLSSVDRESPLATEPTLESKKDDSLEWSCAKLQDFALKQVPEFVVFHPTLVYNMFVLNSQYNKTEQSLIPMEKLVVSGFYSILCKYANNSEHDNKIYQIGLGLIKKLMSHSDNYNLVHPALSLVIFFGQVSQVKKENEKGEVISINWRPEFETVLNTLTTHPLPTIALEAQNVDLSTTYKPE